MKANVDKAHNRGHANHGWLNTYHSFSFANYYNTERMNFGALRVLNDDTVLFGYGFDTHPHKNMEVVSIPIKGALHHVDSTGKDDVIRRGQIQVMSTGSGIYHSEYNDVVDQTLEFLQIWVIPNKADTAPEYSSYDYKHLMADNRFTTIIAPDGTAPASIKQEAWFSIGEFNKNARTTYNLHGEGNGVYLFVISGSVVLDDLNDLGLGHRDGVGIENVKEFELSFSEESVILLIEVPMK